MTGVGWFSYRVADRARLPQLGWSRAGGAWSVTLVVGWRCVSVYRAGRP